MSLSLTYLYFHFVLTSLLIVFVYSDSGIQPNSSESEEYYHNLFIMSRMKHLKAVRDLKQLSNSVKQHQLVTDLAKKTFRALDESRNVLTIASETLNLERIDHGTERLLDVIKYTENTAFFCDLLVFFPEITLKLVDANLFWRITLIDSIEYTTSSNLNFMDENTNLQLNKASKILSEGPDTQEQDTEKASKEARKDTKKPQRRPKLSANEL